MNTRIKFALTLICVACFAYNNIYAQQDSIKTHQLKTVEVKALVRSNSNLSTSPEQTITKSAFTKINAFQVSDALKFLSGVQIKDYGGIGGLKTVSLRNMGAKYTAVAYDGIPITNYMTGQVDVGRFSLDNVEMLRVNIGEADNIFLPARLQALGGSLDIITRPSNLSDENKTKLAASFKTGSWGLINPSIFARVPIHENFIFDGSFEYLISDGDYPYKQTYGLGSNAQTVSRNRVNSDIETFKGEINLSGVLNNGGELSSKIHYYNSDRGIPGPSFYYNENNTGERVKDENTFAQIGYKQSLNHKWKFQANAKYDISNTDYNNLQTLKKDRYEQTEAYANAILLYRTTDNLSFSLSNDVSYGTFNSYDVEDAKQTSLQTSLSGKYRTSRFTATASLLNHYNNNSKQVNSTFNKKSNHISPYLGVSVRPLKDRALRVRAFYKNAYRLPTFGDLYYADVARNLKAENAHQFNIGFTTVRSSGILFPYFSFSIDAYYNKIDNKIVIEPRQSQFKASVRNLGNVDIKGLDLNLEFHIAVSSNVTAEVSSSYTFQDVKENKEGRKLILAYTPKHSGSTYLSLRMPWFNFNYNILFSGKRYYNQEAEPEFKLDAYSEHGVSLNKLIKYKGYSLNLSAECLNIYNKQYEVVRSYPMPGRSFRFGIKFIH
ncbi:vitamin B12 transporter [Dysgonomonadaceae bacterium PH5-43]|nr:vitamin B12 transporter [Dysgonomonadaceae bacterium PH5-43]